MEKLYCKPQHFHPVNHLYKQECDHGTCLVFPWKAADTQMHLCDLSSAAPDPAQSSVTSTLCDLLRLWWIHNDTHLTWFIEAMVNTCCDIHLVWFIEIMVNTQWHTPTMIYWGYGEYMLWHPPCVIYWDYGEYTMTHTSWFIEAMVNTCCDIHLIWFIEVILNTHCNIHLTWSIEVIMNTQWHTQWKTTIDNG